MKKTTKKAAKSAAILTLKDACDYTDAGAKEIAAWLRRQAATILKHRKLLSSRYVARYMYS